MQGATGVDPEAMTRQLQQARPMVTGETIGNALRNSGMSQTIDGMISALTLPGDALYGKVDPSSPEGMGRVMNLAGLLTMGGGATAPLREAGLGIFGGKLAKTADLAALEKATTLERAGAYPDEIWSQTGWGRGTDGQWRFEIPDDQARVIGSIGDVPGEEDIRPLSQNIQHDELYKAYPDLLNMDSTLTRHEGNTGMHYGGPGGAEGMVASGYTPDDQLSTALHEIQHAVQSREGFARGGAPGQKETRSIAGDVRQSAANEVAQLDNEMHAFQDNWVAGQGITPKDMDYTRWMKQAASEWRKQFPEKADRLNNAYADMDAKSYDIYKRLAGEVESRNVSNRMHWTSAERRDVPPVFTQDIPNNRQFVVGQRNGPSVRDSVVQAMKGGT